MSTEETAKRFIRAATAYFCWSAVLFQRKVQGFLAHLPRNLAPEQSQWALKALGFQTFGFIQYALL